MLEKLIIKNLAIIEDVEIKFHQNQTALTGETGAGKSLIIDSLKLIFGARADSDLIRFKEEEAIIKAIFNIDDEEYIIERWISRKDKNKILINNEIKTLTELRLLGLTIGDIHEQHDTLELLKPEASLKMIDKMGDYDNLLNEYTILRHEYLESLKKFSSATKKESEEKETLELYKYQFDELKKANLEIDETYKLERQIETLTHQKTILDELNKSYMLLKNIDDENLLYDAYKAMENIKSYNKSFNHLKERIENIYYETTDIKNELFNEIDNLKDLSVLELDVLQERFYFLKDLENKYGKTNNELILYIDELEEEILKIDNYDSYLEKLKEQMNNAFNKAYSKALEISNARKNVALKLEKDFINLIKDLAINYCDFKVDFKELKELSELGVDDVTFLISLNEGEPLMPFYKVASGGELSRSMLALKIIYLKAHKLKLIVFDEIDLGISGEAARKVSNLLHELSKTVQVITITHLPQVAAYADMHYHISKYTKSSRTNVNLELLEKEKRIYTLAYMLSGDNLSGSAIMHAKSLLAEKK